MNFNYKNLLPVLFAGILLNACCLQLKAQQTLFIDKQEYSCASSFSIAVRTKYISNVVALQGTLTWDTAVVKYNSISFGSSGIALNSGNVNVSAAGAGHITFLWFDNNLQGRSAVDSGALYTINFITNGTGKGKGFVKFDNTPTSLEIDTLDANGFPIINQAAEFKDGYIITPFIYSFVGSGNWNIAANWKNNVTPPGNLPPCSEIIINPSGNNECVLNVPQTISSGAKLTVAQGKNFFIPGNVSAQ